MTSKHFITIIKCALKILNDNILKLTIKGHDINNLINSVPSTYYTYLIIEDSRYIDTYLHSSIV